MSKEYVGRLLEALLKGDPDTAEIARREINERHPPRLAGAMAALSHQKALSLANKPDHGRTIEEHADEVVATTTAMEQEARQRGRSR